MHELFAEEAEDGAEDEDEVDDGEVEETDEGVTDCC